MLDITTLTNIVMRRFVVFKSTALALAAAGGVLVLGTPLIAEAAALVTGRDIKDNTVSSVDFRDGTVRSVDVRNGTLQRADLRDGVIPAPTTRTVVVEDLNPDDVWDETWTHGPFTLAAMCRDDPVVNEEFRDFLNLQAPGGYTIVSPLDGNVARSATSGPAWFFAPGSDTGIIQVRQGDHGLTITASRHRGSSSCTMVVTTSTS